MKNNFSTTGHKGLDFRQIILIFSLIEALQLVVSMSSFPFLFPFLFPAFLYFMYLGIRTDKISAARYWYLYFPFVMMLGLSVYFNMFNDETDVASGSRALFISLFFAIFFLIIFAVVARKLKKRPDSEHIDYHVLTSQVSLIYLVYTLVFVFQVIFYGRLRAVQEVVESVWLLKVLIVISIALKFICLFRGQAGHKKPLSGNGSSSHDSSSDGISSRDIKICRKKLELALEEAEAF